MDETWKVETYDSKRTGKKILTHNHTKIDGHNVDLEINGSDEYRDFHANYTVDGGYYKGQSVIKTPSRSSGKKIIDHVGRSIHSFVRHMKPKSLTMGSKLDKNQRIHKAFAEKLAKKYGGEVSQNQYPHSDIVHHTVHFKEDYKGHHQAPDAEGGSPMHDVTKNGTYPKDFYDYVGFKYYSDQGGKHDSTVHSIVTSKKGLPGRLTSIYRAIPKHIKGKEAKINKGDWVTPHPAYAREHGESLHGKGNYRVVKSVVHARDLHTDGNSIHEWGYDPQPFDKEEYLARRSRIAAKKATS